MKKALSLYEDLLSAFDYLCASWLHYVPSKSVQSDVQDAFLAACFLYDNIFAKEGAGRDLTAAAAQNHGKSFVPSSLSGLATKIRLNMTEKAMSTGGTPLRDYVRWVGDEHPVVLDSLKDEYGLIVLALTDEVVTCIMADASRLSSVEVAEICLLYIATTFHLNYKELEGPLFKTRKSAPFFLDVEEEMERITTTTLD